MPEPTRQYIFTEGQIKGMFAAVTILMIVVLGGLLLLISARPQGAFTTADTRQFEATVGAASEELSGYRMLEDGTVQIDIDRAIELVADRGVTGLFSQAEAAGQAPVADAPEGQEAGQAGLPDGAQIYGSCSGCHQANGQGIPGAFPPLAGHAADLYATDPEYLAQVVLFGLQGPITVDGAQYNGVMPTWGGQLSDAQIAAVLNYVLSSWTNADRVEAVEPYSAEEIAAQRELDLSMQEVHARRMELDLP
ncbi:MAG TPA: cytochrome c [Trueperaceae bacterium]